MLETKKMLRLGEIYRRALKEDGDLQIREMRNTDTDAVVKIGSRHVIVISEIDGKWRFQFGRKARYISHGVWKMTTKDKKRRKVNLNID